MALRPGAERALRAGDVAVPSALNMIRYSVV